jgi:hypothetical protein
MRERVTGGIVAAVVGVGAAVGTVTTLIERQGKAAGFVTRDEVQRIAVDFCPYVKHEQALVQAVAELQLAVKANTNAVHSLDKTLALLAQKVESR